ncbi:SDR family oxidoreductase [Brevibacterium sp. VCM10]|uniref:SDR family oxidoreductase n=1 Tax=Brevibacterium sp. VCM10 TaxID=1381751 RepID=UPI00046F2C73|nr:SDR family oxidoreductase [Brevibacterium sp. VCM10]
MTKTAILGASGQIARWVVDGLAQDADAEQTLLVRHPEKLGTVPGNATVVTADVLDTEALTEAVSGLDIVYANLTGDNMGEQAASVIKAMDAAGVKRLVFVLSLGIYDEVPGTFGEWNRQTIGPYLGTFREAADVIEASDLDYTLLRPAWLDDQDEVDYELTEKGEPYKGTVVSRKSVADLILTIIRNPDKYIGANLGVNKPGSEADKPYFM